MDKSPIKLSPTITVKSKFRRSVMKIERPKINYEEQIMKYKNRQDKAKLKPK